jgi:hypothetical protein
MRAQHRTIGLDERGSAFHISGLRGTSSSLPRFWKTARSWSASIAGRGVTIAGSSYIRSLAPILTSSRPEAM